MSITMYIIVCIYTFSLRKVTQISALRTLLSASVLGVMRRSRFTGTRSSIEPRQLSCVTIYLCMYLSHSRTSYCCCFLYELPSLEASSYLFDFLLKYSLRNPQSLCLTRSYLETLVINILTWSRLSSMRIPESHGNPSFMENKAIKLQAIRV